MSIAVPELLVRAAASAVGGAVERWAVVTAPYSSRPVCRVELEDGRSIIAKTGAPATSAMGFSWRALVEREDWMYRNAAIAPDLRPERLGLVEAEGWLAIVLSDLSRGERPTWTPATIPAAAQALHALHQTPRPAAALPRDPHDRDTVQPFFARVLDAAPGAGDLPVGLATDAFWSWLRTHAPALQRAYERSLDPANGALVHNNVRDDNMFWIDGRIVIFDWDHAIWATPAYDAVYWALGIEVLTGGPAEDAFGAYARLGSPPSPDEVGGVLSFWTGYFLHHLQAAKSAPANQELRVKYLWPTLRWAVDALRLPPPPVDFAARSA